MNEQRTPDANEDNELARLIISLGKEYAEILPAKFAQMHAALEQLKEELDKGELTGGGLKKNETISTLYFLLHSLSGSAGSFGFIALGKQAGLLEQQMQIYIADNAWSEKTLIDLSTGISTLEAFLPAIIMTKINPDGV
ncbi:Hpt domain-containing protein [Glaciimonas sp. CA11.2]|uniref:Hpt domain-containing protein n=1 Tax=Glaciimonas sp. CA11.2 TaxID=3048601 RepID=UPI002AB4E994|nr:Hpt domain-containing protein [Glaciimonas sp. CA11.2]MDY7546833.1 Hpt domain-containing protein [Glaciimonas sp. CA11.2]MEB0163707.1 Hpt domain-containing protein [Glaciimonas sp. CA11.2]